MDAGAWLARLGMSEYAPHFAANHIGMDLLPTLTGDDLVQLGVASLGHRKILLRAIAELSEAAPQTAAAAPDLPAPPAQGERRPVTVLFADLSGFTDLGRRLDPEAVHALLEAFFASADRVIAEHGGYIDKHIGDSVMAVFGAPIAHGNDVERAASAALGILAALPGVPRPDGIAVEAHVGMAQGEVVAARTGSADHATYTVTGDAVNLAARLTGLARPGEVVVSDSVRRLLPAGFVLAEGGDAEVKGISGTVRFWRLTAREDAADAGRPAFVGRGAELAQLAAIARTVASGGAAAHVHLRGEAGIGKSRIVEQFTGEARALGFRSVTAAFLDFGVEQGRDATQSLARALAGPDAPGAESAELGLHMRDLQGLATGPEDRAALAACPPEARRQGQAAALAELIAARAAAAPLLVVVEDLHWATPAQAGLIGAAISAAGANRCLFLTTSRPQGDPCAHPGGASLLSPGTILEVGPLRDDDARRMAAGLLGQDADIASGIISRSGGHPLFLEHLLRFSLGGDANRVPDSVRNVVLAGVDRLDQQDRQLVQAASVLGQRGAVAALAAVFGRPLSDADFRHRHLVRAEGAEFRFAHALIRDAVYETLLGPTRRSLHARAAAHFAGHDLPLHALHLARAEDPAAASACLAAATEAFDRAAFDRAAELAQDGLALPANPATRSALGRIAGRAHLARGRTQEAIAALAEAAAETDEPEHRARAEIALAHALGVTERADEAVALLDAAEARLAGTANWADLSELWLLRGNLHFPRAELDLCRTAHEQALELAERAGSVAHVARALSGLGDAAYAEGRIRTSERRFADCVALAESNGLLATAAANRGMAVITRLFAGSLADLDAEAETAIAAARAIGQARAEIIACHAAMCVRLLGGRPDEVAPHFARGQELAASTGALRFASENLAFAGEAERLMGNRAKAVALLEEALAIARRTGMGFIGPLVLGYLAMATGDPARRRDLMTEAEALLEGGRLAHNVFFLRISAIECALEDRAPDAIFHHASLFEAAFTDEPLDSVDFLVARARALARHIGGGTGPETWNDLRTAAEAGRALGYLTFVPALEAALAPG